MEQPALLEMRNITKEFPGVKALDGVSLTVRPGTVHALMGENGAGKSTLMKCLFGIYAKNAGTIVLDGKEVDFKSSKEALENGVAMVHQELNQALTRSVQENLWLGRYPKVGGIMANSAELTRSSARDEAAVRMDMNALLDSLVSDRQDMGQDVSLEGSCARPWTVRPNSFRRCLSNLLDNALRYSGSVRIQLREKDDILQIDVLDDGPGIPPDMLEQVFEPFFRLDEARSPHTGGRGRGPRLRLPGACRNGGELSLHNRPEGGLCARLCLYRSAMETETL